MTLREMYLERKVSYKKDFHLGFGIYVYVFNPHFNKRSLDHRAQEAIALYPTGNSNGAWVLLHLKTMRIIMRGRWTKMPVNDSLIEK